MKLLISIALMFVLTACPAQMKSDGKRIVSKFESKSVIIADRFIDRIFSNLLK